MSFAADRLGAELIDQAKQAQATYARIGDIMISDDAKLTVVDASGDCDPNTPGCQKEYAYTAAANVAFSAIFDRGIQRIAYEKLLPLGYHVYQLKNFDRLNPSDRGRPPDVPAWYRCGPFVHPFTDFRRSRTPRCWKNSILWTTSTCATCSCSPSRTAGSFRMCGTARRRRPHS